MSQTDTSPPFKYPQKWWFHHFPELSWGFSKLSWDLASYLAVTWWALGCLHVPLLPLPRPGALGLWLTWLYSFTPMQQPCSCWSLTNKLPLSSSRQLRFKWAVPEFSLWYLNVNSCRLSLFWAVLFQTLGNLVIPRCPFPQIQFGDSQPQPKPQCFGQNIRLSHFLSVHSHVHSRSEPSS